MILGGILLGAGVVTIVMSCASSAGGVVLLRGTHQWVTACERVERRLTDPVP
jgi:hypothetical protein